MATKRSQGIWLVGYFLAKYGSPGGRSGKPAPPAELEAATWNETYALFWPALGDGRSEETFANSLKNARDTFDSHLNIGRVGWRTTAQAAGDREPQPLSDDAIDGCAPVG